MLRTVGDQPSLWEAVLPDELRRLPAELARVDAELTTRCGSAAIEGLNEALLAKAAEAKLLRCSRVRVDTTVVPSNVAYPTDAALLAKAVGRIAATGRRILAADGATRTRLRDRSRTAGKRAHAIASKLRSRAAAGRDEAMAAVKKANAELADLADTAAEEAGRLLANAKRALRKARTTAAQRKLDRPDPVAGRRRGRLARAVNVLVELWEATRRIAAQTRQRLAGVTPDGSTRRASLHDPDARPIAKGRLGKPVEFGHKAQVVDNDDGLVLDHDVQPANPADAPRMEPAIKRVARRTGRKPRTVAADRGYGEAGVEDALHDLGVRSVVIPRKGRPTKSPASRGAPPGIPAAPEMAHRMRRPDQQLQLDQRIHGLDQQIAATFRRHHQAKTIESMPGFGPILGAQLLVAAGDLRGYPSAGHLAAAAGLVPVPNESGRRSGNLHKPRRYSRPLRHVLSVRADQHDASGSQPCLLPQETR